MGNNFYGRNIISCPVTPLPSLLPIEGRGLRREFYLILFTNDQFILHLAAKNYKLKTDRLKVNISLLNLLKSSQLATCNLNREPRTINLNLTLTTNLIGELMN
jgi:hypothetical protein